VEFYAVAHGDHDVASRVIESVGDWLYLGGGLAGKSCRGLSEDGRREG